MASIADALMPRPVPNAIAAGRGVPVATPASTPFVWGQGGVPLTAAELERQRKISDALRTTKAPTGPWSLLGDLAGEGVAAYRDSKATDAEAAAQKSVADALAKGDYQSVIANDMATPQQSAVAQALWQQKMQSEDPARQLDMKYKQAEIDALANPKPMEINGQLVDPKTQTVLGDYRTKEADKPKDAPNGYRYAADGSTLEFIPGGPADPSTAGKTTEATRRNQQLATVIVPELQSLIGDGTTANPGTYDALANGWDMARANIPGAQAIGQGPSASFQQAANSLKTIVASYLYSVSGATANPGEVQNQIDVLTPKLNEDPKSVAAKKARLQEMVQAVVAAAKGTPINVPDTPSAGQQAQPPVPIKSDADYNALPSGTQYVAPDGSIRTKR